MCTHKCLCKCRPTNVDPHGHPILVTVLHSAWLPFHHHPFQGYDYFPHTYSQPWTVQPTSHNKKACQIRTFSVCVPSRSTTALLPYLLLQGTISHISSLRVLPLVHLTCSPQEPYSEVVPHPSLIHKRSTK